MTNRRSSDTRRSDDTARLGKGIVVAALVIAAGQVVAMAQTAQSAKTSAGASGSSSNTTQPPARKRQKAETNVLNTRSLFFPDLAHSGEPLSPSEKLRLAATNSVSPATFLGSAFAAGIGQAANSPAGYGQGASAYGQRFGASMATRASTNLLGNFFLCSVLHDDPRFFVRGDGSLKQSIKYALRRVVIIRKDDGGDTFNWPGILAPLGAAGIANTYWPDPQKTVGYTFQSYGWSLAGSAGVNLIKEYWPTITRKVLVPIGMGHDTDRP